LLSRLVFVIFIFENQMLAKDTFVSSEILLDAIKQAEKFQQQANDLISEHPFSSFERQDTNKVCVSQRLDGRKAKGCLQKFSTSQKQSGQILVFISFSMPEVSLKALSQESQKHSAILVMRGLYQDSFVKTALKLQELDIAVDIHPELFETQHITSVPTFVRLENGEPIHSLKGNVTLGFVMKTFEDQRIKEAS
jgi:conjugal transfer pilus assembly protein TrbC